jgi:hypothetical protein
LIVAAISSAFHTASAQKLLNHPYPRIATLQWGGGTVDWLRRFDLVITLNKDSLAARQLQALRNDIYILATSDWTDGEPVRSQDPNSFPVEWRVRTPSGAYVPSHDGFYLADLTQNCARYNGETYAEALARVLYQQTDWDGFDGVNSDGLWTFPWTATRSTGIDLDRNGLDDYAEPGKGVDWVRQQWQKGANTMMDTLRSLFRTRWGRTDQKIIAYWSVLDTMCLGVSNGIGWENAPDHAPTTFTSWMPLIDQWESGGTLPRVNYVCAAVRYDSAHAPVRKKDYFRFMRWMLGVTLLNDSYFMMDDDKGNHYYNFYYDEFDVNLGFPTSPAFTLPNGCSVRFFDGGACIVNSTNASQSVSSADIASLTGYQGPYFRFRGNQDIGWNNGAQFQSVSLSSTKASWTGAVQNVGDAIILVKKPTDVVSDIIIDNAYSATSPGSAEAVISGFTWDSEANGNRQNPLWSTGPYLDSQSDPTYWRSQYAPAGNGSAVAVFTPTIKLGGSYRVYEWHGWRGRDSSSYLEATNVPCTVTHAKGTTKISIDQSKNAGKWNLLGTFTFNPGTTGSVKITNQANGYVIADAFKFEYVPGSSTPTTGVRGDVSPLIFKLGDNYPNPFNPSTRIEFEIPEREHVSLTVYDVLGRQVATLVNDIRPPGVYTAEWRPLDLASGVYFSRLIAGNSSLTKRMLYLR